MKVGDLVKTNITNDYVPQGSLGIVIQISAHPMTSDYKFSFYKIKFIGIDYIPYGFDDYCCGYLEVLSEGG